jgi:hypothetical protein
MDFNVALILFHIFQAVCLCKVFSLHLALLLLVITMILYAGLSGVNTRTVYVWREIILGLFCLLFSATLFHFCNYAHYFANIVRYQKILFEHIYGVFHLC